MRYTVLVVVVGAYSHRETAYDGFSRSRALAAYRAHRELDGESGGVRHRTVIARRRCEPVRGTTPQTRGA